MGIKIIDGEKTWKSTEKLLIDEKAKVGEKLRTCLDLAADHLKQPEEKKRKALLRKYGDARVVHALQVDTLAIWVITRNEEYLNWHKDLVNVLLEDEKEKREAWVEYRKHNEIHKEKMRLSMKDLEWQEQITTKADGEAEAVRLRVAVQKSGSILSTAISKRRVAESRLELAKQAVHDSRGIDPLPDVKGVFPKYADRFGLTKEEHAEIDEAVRQLKAKAEAKKTIF